MRSSTHRRRAAALAGAALLASLLPACSGAAASPAPDPVGLGRHLVNRVAMCIDCHSQRGADGTFTDTGHLAGSPLGFAPTVEMPWAPFAPPLVRSPRTDKELVALLTTGRWPDGTAPLPPMPTYRLTREEAVGVVAYLRSLGTP